MITNAARPGVGRGFTWAAMALAWTLYVAYFFLPVTGPAPWGTPDSTMTGAQTLGACFVIPLLWPVAVGHLLFWIGSLLLAMGRSRGAAVAGLLGLLISIVTVVLFWPVHVGMYCKVLAMAIVGLSALTTTIEKTRRPALQV